MLILVVIRMEPYLQKIKTLYSFNQSFLLFNSAWKGIDLSPHPYTLQSHALQAHTRQSAQIRLKVNGIVAGELGSLTVPVALWSHAFFYSPPLTHTHSACACLCTHTHNCGVMPLHWFHWFHCEPALSLLQPLIGSSSFVCLFPIILVQIKTWWADNDAARLCSSRQTAPVFYPNMTNGCEGHLLSNVDSK